jgi:Xaa-Pro aminopeptidase
MFTPERYSERRLRLQRQLGGGLLLFLGNDESPMNYADNSYPFRQDSSFLYYFGIDQPGYAALLDADTGETTVFADDLSLDDIVWTGLQPTVREYAERAGLRATAPAGQLGAQLGSAVAAGRAIHFLPPYRPEHRLKRDALLGPCAEASIPLIRAVAEMRIRKEPEEIAEIERAVNVSVEMHLAALRMVRPGLREAEIAARVTEVALAAGGGLSFPVIATVRGGVLHNHHYGNRLEAGQLFLLDAGAETASHYAGDLSSTCPVDRAFSPRQQDLYNLVLRAHLAAVAALEPGRAFRDIHLLACRTLASGLKDLGLMKGDVDEAVARGAHALFFPCGLGHLMGLDVHDMENLGEVWVGYEGQPKSTQFGLKSLRLARALQPGYVLTVEPGLYCMPELQAQWRAERRFLEHLDYDAIAAFGDFGGLRIEENFLVTADGARLLGQPKPRSGAELEAARA